MELVYLWVEEYKNIYHQGFNFSPRFECKFYDKYDEDGNLENNCKLVICDKEKGECLDKDAKKCKPCKDNGYIKDFFGDNINVTAIVGKNGSGKSSLLDLIHNIFNKNSVTKYILIIKNKDQLEYLNYTSKELDIYPKIIQKDSLDKIDWFLHYYHNDNVNKYQKHFIDLSVSSIGKNISLIQSSHTKEFKLSSFMFLPKIVLPKLKLDDILMKIAGEDFSLNYIPHRYGLYLNGKCKHYTKISSIINEQEMSKLIENIDDFHKFLILLHIHHCDNKILSNKKYMKKLYKGYSEQIKEENFNKLIKINDIELSKLTQKERQFYFDEFYELFDFDFIDEKNRRFKDLSHGEQTIFGILLTIYKESLDLGSNKANPFSKRPLYYTTYFMLDESDLSLHPNWQKQYINEIITLLNEINGNYFLILTTHSPFLLSDIPKQNIIFLDTYKEEDEEVKNGKQKVGNCKVVDGLNEKKETFGANIHTLLSDSFFMEDGLMGEFAKGKIESIKKFYNKVIKYKDNDKVKKDYKCFYEKKQKEFWDIQSIIGEPFLQKIVKNQLEEIELILLGKNDAIDKEIARLQALKESFNND